LQDNSFGLTILGISPPSLGKSALGKMKTNGSEVVTVESTLDTSSSVEKGDVGPAIGLNERIQLPAELAHLTRDEQDALEKRLVRKMDMRLMPIVIIMFWLNILDRNNIANAKIAGLDDDLNMSSS
jgi:hypothetical protein